MQKDIWETGKNEKITQNKPKINILVSIIYIIIGIILLRYGGNLVVDEATELARLFGVSEKIIGLTIVAFGTALPELITSIFAAVKDESGLAIGNLVGSCILNAFLILGTGAVITPLAFSQEFIESLTLLATGIIYIWLSCFIGKKDTITRYKAGVLILAFSLYMVNLFK